MKTFLVAMTLTALNAFSNTPIDRVSIEVSLDPRMEPEQRCALAQRNIKKTIDNKLQELGIQERSAVFLKVKKSYYNYGSLGTREYPRSCKGEIILQSDEVGLISINTLSKRVRRKFEAETDQMVEQHIENEVNKSDVAAVLLFKDFGDPAFPKSSLQYEVNTLKLVYKF